MDAEVIRVIKNAPKWDDPSVHGYKIEMILPVKMRLDQDEDRVNVDTTSALHYSQSIETHVINIGKRDRLEIAISPNFTPYNSLPAEPGNAVNKLINTYSLEMSKDLNSKKYKKRKDDLEKLQAYTIRKNEALKAALKEILIDEDDKN